MGCETERERREEWRAKRLTRERVFKIQIVVLN